MLLLLLFLKRLSEQGWESEINTQSVRRPRPHNINS